MSELKSERKKHISGRFPVEWVRRINNFVKKENKKDGGYYKSSLTKVIYDAVNYYLDNQGNKDG